MKFTTAGEWAVPSPTILRTCPKGHRYRRSSDCPTCPVCEELRKPKDGFLALLGAPARRALEREGITTVSRLSRWSKEDLLELHGLGPSSIPRLQKALKEKGLTFQRSERK